MKRLKYFFIVFVISITSFCIAEPNEPEPVIDEDVFIEALPMDAPDGSHAGVRHKFMFISSEMEFGGKVVKGAPYSAEAITERTQTLGDGNRIAHKSTAKVFRDSEGRTRREQQLDAIGNWEASEDAPQRIFIQDPVAKLHYILEPENQIARKMNVEGMKMRRASKPGEDEDVFEMRAPHPGGPGNFTKEVMIRESLSDKDAKKESLGKQTIEGLVVEGSRTTITIAAGKMGNELPIQIVSERWYSPDLQTNVMTRHSDPRFGETVYQLTRIGRGEQDRSLFQVPQGYKIETGPPKMIKREVIKD